MSKRLRVEVTQEDIVKGNPGFAQSCPIARAIHRALPESATVEVSSIIKVVEKTGGWRVFYPTKRALLFMGTFDKREAVAPTTFYFREANA